MTANRERYFGKIINVKMHLSEIGWITRVEWLKTPDIRPDMNILLDEFCIMPDHFHGTIIFGGVRNCSDAMHCIPTIAQPHRQFNKFGPQSKNLGSVIRGFKSAVKTFATKNNIEFAWQSRFHDRIIRDEREFDRIKNYIVNNPADWGARNVSELG